MYVNKKSKKVYKKDIYFCYNYWNERVFFFVGIKCINIFWFLLYIWNLKIGFLFIKVKNNKYMKLSMNLKRGKRFLYEVNNMDFEIYLLEIFIFIDIDIVYNVNDVIGIIVIEYLFLVWLLEKMEWLNKMINEESLFFYFIYIFI